MILAIGNIDGSVTAHEDAGDFAAVPLDRVIVREKPEVRLAAEVEVWVSRIRAGDSARLFASIASTVVSVLNRDGRTNHAAARRELGWDRTGMQALALLGL